MSVGRCVCVRVSSCELVRGREREPLQERRGSVSKAVRVRACQSVCE